jgi:transcriptional regulator with XRE-family HTH domain
VAQWEERLAETIGARVKKLRQATGISQEKLAVRMGMSRQTVFEIEHGVRLSEWSTYGRLADALGVDVASVLPLDPSTLELLGAHSSGNKNLGRRSNSPVAA